jgi:predicted Zn-dependent protease
MVGGAQTKTASFLELYGNAAYMAKDFPRALRIYNDLAELNPKDPSILKRIYDVDLKTGNSDAALSALRKYAALSPKDASAQRDLGDLLYKNKERAAALAAYSAALKADPSIKGFYKNYVDLVLDMGKPEEKVGALNGAINAGEADAKVYMTLGGIYKNSQNYPRAI